MEDVPCDPLVAASGRLLDPFASGVLAAKESPRPSRRTAREQYSHSPAAIEPIGHREGEQHGPKPRS